MSDIAFVISHAVSTVEQMFPMNDSYSCHSPNIKLKCNFSVNPFTATWSVLVNGRDPELVTPSTPGHTVDASAMQSGTIYLEIHSTVYSEGNSYSCTAVYLDRDQDTEVSDVFPIPIVEGE